MRLDEELLLDLVGRFQEAALAPAAWPQALERLSDALGGVPLHFGVQRLPKGMDWMVSVRRDPIYHRIFQERFAPPNTNPVMEAAKSMRPRVLYQRSELIDDADYHASAMYHETIRPMGQGEFALAMLVRSRDYVVPLTIYRRLGDGSFTEPELTFLQRLLPHLSRCVQIQLRLETAEAESRELGGALDRLPMAVLLLDSQAKLIRANPAAEALLQAGDGLAIAEGRVVASDRRTSERLRRLVAAAAAPTEGHGRDPGGCTALPRRPPARPLMVVVATLPRGTAVDGVLGGRVVAVLLVRDPDRCGPAPGAHLAELYGLTAAEARTAEALASGLGPREIAAKLGIGLATVRTHLHRAFDKTGTTSQADLMRLLLTSGSLPG
jgi:DNA-binding CsgD family transcriptional regulator/PAS domain-containing protein